MMLNFTESGILVLLARGNESLNDCLQINSDDKEVERFMIA